MVAPVPGKTHNLFLRFYASYGCVNVREERLDAVKRRLRRRLLCCHDVVCLSVPVCVLGYVFV